MSESLTDNYSTNESDNVNGTIVGDAFFKGNITTDIVKLDKHFRRIWRSKLSLDSYPLVLIQHCDVLRKVFRDDNSLKDYEKEYLESKLLEYEDKFNMKNKTGAKRLCEDCGNSTYATQFCEFCIQKYLEQNFHKWDSGDNKINKIIQESLERRGEPQQIVLKQLNSSMDDSWLNEVTSHFSIDKIAQYILPCYGITRNPQTDEYMLVLNIMEQNLQEYLINNKNIEWEQKFDIIYEVTATEVPPYYDIDLKNKKTLNVFTKAVIGGMRPDTNIGISEKYKTLMQQCWDADPANRPDTLIIWQKIRELRVEFLDALDKAMNNGNNFIEEEILNISKEPIVLSDDQFLQSRRSTSCILAPFKNTSKPINVSSEISNKFYMNLRKRQIENSDDLY
ncbi:4648_t:CDS:2 [Acaulospora morrowiae]|uniref:4648_t:CDS:1 n=1 Tax=Acaulospora morrowiae TaxID=94023 RepID=A0A9N9FZW0_9GLOM|nr:4648_t:CDS:2 [Acaulospora morrowiae]